MEENVALERHFKPVIEYLKQIVKNTVSDEPVKDPIKNETFFSDEEYMDLKPKRKRSNASFENSFTPIKSMSKTVPSSDETPKILKPRESYEHSHASFVEDVYETADKTLESPSDKLFKRGKVVRRYTVSWDYWDKDTWALLDGDRRNEKSIMFTACDISATMVQRSIINDST